MLSIIQVNWPSVVRAGDNITVECKVGSQLDVLADIKGGLEGAIIWPSNTPIWIPASAPFISVYFSIVAPSHDMLLYLTPQYFTDDGMGGGWWTDEGTGVVTIPVQVATDNEFNSLVATYA